MNIGIYKPGKKIYFGRNEDDHAAISVEITRVISILTDHLHDVYILSDTDYIPGTDSHVFKSVPEALDKVFIYNGIDLTHQTIDSCLKYTTDVNLIVTDLSLLPQPDMIKKFRKVFTQSKRFGEYAAIEQHEFYNCKIKRRKKWMKLYFGGTERGRTKDFFEYVYRPNVIWYGKSDTLGVKRYIPYHEHIDKMKCAKYSIVIGDAVYNQIGFITPRYYECIRYGVIPFVDMKYDPDEIMIKKNDFRRVKNFEEVLFKMACMEKNVHLYNEILAAQEKEMTDDMFYGDNIYNKIMK